MKPSLMLSFLFIRWFHRWYPMHWMYTSIHVGLGFICLSDEASQWRWVLADIHLYIRVRKYISGNQLLRPILWHLYPTCKPKQVSCVVSGIVNSSATFPVICTSIHPHEWAKRLHHNSNMVCCALQVCLCHGLEVIFYSGPEGSSSYILLKRPTSSPSTSGVIIASQVVWLSLMFKVLQDLFIMPLYFILGNTITDQNETKNKLKTGLAIIVAVFALTTGTLFLAAPSLVKAMAQSPNLVKSICIFW